MELINCSKSYRERGKDKTVFCGISKVFENRIYHLKGDNGTGKSVFCRCILGLEKFTEGTYHNDKKNILYIPDTPLGEEWLTMRENIDLVLHYFGIVMSDCEIGDICRELDVSDIDTNYHLVSSGTAMKVGLFLLFVSGRWDLIVIDEGLSHVDRNVRERILEELGTRSREGSTVIIVDHNLGDSDMDDCWETFFLEDRNEKK